MRITEKSYCVVYHSYSVCVCISSAMWLKEHNQTLL